MTDMKKFTVHYSDGLGGGGGMLPDAPSDENQAASLAEAGEMFRKWMVDSGNDYHRADGYGAPCAWIYLTSGYDGIAYGDPYAAFERGPKGGIARASL
jgi:hypothetical protein